MNAIRVPKAKFKYNMRPFIEEAKGGKIVIVTNGGSDEFQIVPCAAWGKPPGVSNPPPAGAFEGINLDEPAFAGWGGK
jgi:hypothetical protein